MNQMTLAEAMAMAVIKGDLVAAYALADLLQEQRANPNRIQEEAAKMMSERRTVVDGYAVFHWPEFQAFAKRLGFVWNLHIRSATIRLAEGEMVVIEQNYIARDGGPQTENPTADPRMPGQSWTSNRI